jgi:hypothetical protein
VKFCGKIFRKNSTKANKILKYVFIYLMIIRGGLYRPFSVYTETFFGIPTRFINPAARVPCLPGQCCCLKTPLPPGGGGRFFLKAAVLACREPGITESVSLTQDIPYVSNAADVRKKKKWPDLQWATFFPNCFSMSN